MEFNSFIFQAWKVLEFFGQSWKVMENYDCKGKSEDEFLSKTIKKVCRTEDINLFKFDLSAILK